LVVERHSEGSKIRIVLFSLLVVLLAVSLYIRLMDFFDPWEKGPKGVGGALYHVCADAYYKYGMVNLKFAPYLEPYGSMYLVHPPLSFLLTAIGFHLLPHTEWVVRLFPMLFSLAGIFVFVILVRKYAGFSMSAALFLFSIFVPVNLYYGGMAERFCYGLFILFLIFIAYLKYIDTARIKYLVWMTLLSIIGVWTDFSIYHTIGIPFITHYLILRRKDFRLLVYMLVVLVQIPLFFLYCKYASGMWFNFQYALNVVGRSTQLTLRHFFENQVEFTLEFITVPLLVFSVVGIALWIGKSTIITNKLRLIVLWTFLFGLFEYITYYGRACDEELHIVHLYPFYGITAGIGLVYLIRLKIAPAIDWVKNLTVAATLFTFLWISFDNVSALVVHRKTDAFKSEGQYLNEIWIEDSRAILSFSELKAQVTAYIDHEYQIRVIDHIDFEAMRENSVAGKKIIYQVKSKDPTGDSQLVLSHGFKKAELEEQDYFIMQ